MHIGVLDSGIGGLTVVRAIKQLLPQESIIYYGDTAYLPYGNKPRATIRDRTQRVCSMLLQYPCKAIVVACNSAAAVVYDEIGDWVSHSVPVLNVIDPMLQYVAQNLSGKVVGLIGTEQTISSGIYLQRVQALQLDVQLRALATPLLVPMIETGYPQGQIDQSLIEQYLTDPALQHIDALILGCTHYPIIKPQIEAFYKQQPVTVVASAHATARVLQQTLTAQGLASSCQEHEDHEDHFFVSKLTAGLDVAAQQLWGQSMRIEHRPVNTV